MVLGVLVEELLGFVDLGGQVRAAATVGVVEEHELTVVLADLVLVQGALAVEFVRNLFRSDAAYIAGEHTEDRESKKLRGASCGLQIPCQQISKLLRHLARQHGVLTNPL